MRYTVSLTLASLLTTLHALTITYPTAGSTVDPSQPITVRWTSTSSDPQSFNLVVVSDASSVFTFGDDSTTQVATNVRTSSGSYTIPPNTIAAFGSGFTVSARTTTGDQLATSGAFLLGYGANQVVTGDNGQISLVPAPTGGAAATQTTLSSITFDTSGLEGQSVTATYLPSTDISFTATGTGAQSSGTLSSLVFSTDGVTGNMTIMSSTSTRHSSSASSSTIRGTASASSSAASVAATNAQVKLGAGKEVMGLAGLVAGLFALVA